MDLIQTWYDDRYYCPLDFDTSLIDRSLYSRSQDWEKSKNFCANYLTIFNRFEWNFGTLLRHDSVINFILILSCPFSI